MQTKRVNRKSSIWRNRDMKCDRRRRPQCVKVTVGGRIRVVGASAAARWLGVSRTTLFNVVAGKLQFAPETVELIRTEYPELFADEDRQPKGDLP